MSVHIDFEDSRNNNSFVFDTEVLRLALYITLNFFVNLKIPGWTTG